MGISRLTVLRHIMLRSSAEAKVLDNSYSFLIPTLVISSIKRLLINMLSIVGTHCGFFSAWVLWCHITDTMNLHRVWSWKRFVLGDTFRKLHWNVVNQPYKHAQNHYVLQPCTWRFSQISTEHPIYLLKGAKCFFKPLLISSGKRWGQI